MAKSALLDVLEKTIGKYVENLDTNSLNVALWSGKIELNSLKLDTKAVNAELSLIKPPVPFRVQSGHFVHFQLDVPWVNLMNKPVVAHAQGLYVKIAPHSNNNNNGITISETKSSESKDGTTTGSSKKRKGGGKGSPSKASSSSIDQDPVSEARLQAIESADEFRQQANALRNLAQQDLLEEQQGDSSSSNKQSSSSSSSFGAKLVRRIVENLQVEITDVHISLDSSEGSAGVLLESLNLETTDKDGNRTFVDRTTSKDSFLHKKLEIRGLGLYLDEQNLARVTKKQKSSSTTPTLLRSIQEQENDGNDDDASNDDFGMDHSYVLAPLSFEATLRQADGNVCLEHPKYLLQSGLSSLNILMSKTQVELANKIGQLLTRDQDTTGGLSPLFPEYRPTVPLGTGHKDAAKKWWKYAVRCVGRLKGQQSWVEFYRAFEKRKKYIPLYKRKKYHNNSDKKEASGDKNKKKTSVHETGCHWLKPLSADEQASLDELEMDQSISVQGLMTWRNIADAQVQKEREKYDDSEKKKSVKKTSLFTSLFGSGSNNTKDSEGDGEQEDPPIVLSPEELKNLEAMAMEQQESELEALSNESKMYDVQFVLGSFRINLTSYNYTSLAFLKMGTVSTEFQANADGSYTFDFSMNSLCIEDKITPKSFFPTVLQNQSSHKDVNRSHTKAFSFHVDKTKSGDQHLRVQLSTFEAIASPLLLKELKRFLSVNDTLSSTGRNINDQKINPILAQSLSGSVDLFYDASEGLRSSCMDSTAAESSASMNELLQWQDVHHRNSKQPTSNTTGLSDNISNALFDAWKVRTETRSSWLIDLDIQAPILVLPESCTKATANVLVFDLGHLTLAYGSAVDTPLRQVKDWFKANPKVATNKEREPILDHGNLQISSLSFLIGQVNDWRRLVKKHEHRLDDADQDNAVIEPITVGMDFGVEASSAESVPRVCVFAVLPSIGLAISPDQLSRVLNVYKSWTKLLFQELGGGLQDLGARNATANQPSAMDDNASVSSAGSRVSEMAQQLLKDDTVVSSSSGHPVLIFKQTHVDLKLQRFSIKVTTDDGLQGMEAHLVSVGSAVTLLSNGLSKIKLNMGWFWILDNLQNNFARMQRLVAHSSLPASTSDRTAGSEYEIMSRLNEIGVFDPSYGGSSDLADISVVYSPQTIGKLDPFLEDSLSASTPDDIAANTLVDATFSSLFVNWNPKAITQMLQSLTRFTNYLEENLKPERQSTVILMAPGDAIAAGNSHVDELDKKEGQKGMTDSSCLVVRAKMTSVELCLRSARDDLPIFTLTMSSARTSYVTKANDGMVLRASLGNISISTPDMGRTHQNYRTLLGLSPGKSDSLLSVFYAEGKAGIATIRDGRGASDLAALAHVTISPMRMVCIQAQVLALVEYATQGILGALTSQAASSAANAAAEMTTSELEKKLFIVRATGFEILLPETAYSDHYCSVKTGVLSADYTALPDERGGEAKVSISDVMVADVRGTEMQGSPIEMGMDVVLPPEGVGTLDDQAFRIKISMSSAPFILLKHQYQQILATLDKNIGEPDLFLRDDDLDVNMLSQTMTGESSQNEPIPENLTHAGVTFVENPRRMYIDITIHSLSLDLLGEHINDNIVRLHADRAVVGLVLLPHEDKFSARVSLRDLVCWDERVQAIGRNERALISQDSADEMEQKFFDVSFEKTGQEKTEIGLFVGSPRLVVLPDAINELLGFISDDNRELNPQTENDEAVSSGGRRVYDVTSSDDGNEFEVEARSVPAETEECSLSISLLTRQCSIVLVDLGGNSLTGQADKSSTVKETSVAETVVLRGVFDAKGSTTSRIDTGALISVEGQMHGDGVEIYTALGDNTSAVQVLDPFSFSVVGHARGMDTTSRKFDVRVAVLSPIDMCISMRNFALLNAILESIQSSSYGANGEDSSQDLVLSPQDARLIEHLDHALEATEHELQSVKSFSSETAHVYSDGSSTMVTAEPMESKSALNITLPDAKLTIVNDLQGLDDALIRFDLLNVVANVQVREGERLQRDSEPYTGFDANLNCSITADYFANSEGLWKDFFLRPWELTVRGGRDRNLKLKSNRPSTFVDVESFPCHISFSEEFLLSLASANQMWTVYSMTTSSLLESVQTSEQTSAKPTDQSMASSIVGSTDVGQTSTTTPKPQDLRRSIPVNVKRGGLKRSLAATAARTIVTALPYALENNSGFDIDFKIVGFDGKVRSCSNGSIEYFRFPPPKSKGTGGKRLYGQDVTFQKQVSVRLLNSWIEIESVDDEIGSRRIHAIQDSLVVISQVLREGKTTVVHVSSGVDIHCRTSIPVEVRMPVATRGTDGLEYVGVCGSMLQSNRNLSILQEGKLARASSKLGLPVDKMRSYREEWKKTGRFTCELSIYPYVPLTMNDNFELRGDIQFALDRSSLTGSQEIHVLQTEVVCRPVPGEGQGSISSGEYSFVVQIRVIGRMVDQIHPCLDIVVEPRALIENKLPIAITIRTPMPQTYSAHCDSDSQGTTHDLDPDKSMEIYTLSQSIAISVKCQDNPVGGTPTGWIYGNWVDLPLTSGYRLPEPLRCNFPFRSYSGTDYNIPGGTEFLIADGAEALSELSTAEKSQDNGRKELRGVASSWSSNDESLRTFFVTVCNFSVDHTGEILFGLVESEPSGSRRRNSTRKRGDSTPLGAYKSRRHHGRLSLLPESHERIQLIHLTMEGDVGMRTSQPFQIEEVSMSNGGVNSTPVLWEDGSASGFFVYQKLINSFQSEMHVVPEFIVFNGSKKYHIRVRQPKGADVVIDPGKIAPLQRSSQQPGIISISWVEFDGATSPLKVEKLGLRVAIVRSGSGLAIGSIAIQTVVGSSDSRLVIKLADIRLGSEARQALAPRKIDSMLDYDFLRFRIQWSELKLTLNEANPVVGKRKAFLESAFDKIANEQGADPQTRYRTGDASQVGETWMDARDARNRRGSDDISRGLDAVCCLVLQQVTVDWQRVFKDDPKPSALRSDKERLQSQERSQFSMIIHKIRITDETKDSQSPLVLDYTTANSSFFDLCIRVKGPLDAELVNVDLFDLNLAYGKGKPERIVLSTSESFAWKLVDLGDQILAAAGEIAGVPLELEWDEGHGGYKVKVRDSQSLIEEGSRYAPPNSEQLYDILLARVSPFVLVVSFDRSPVSSKNSPVKNGKNKALMNYFTQRLRFKIDRAELKFSKYEATHIKGPADRIIEIISTVYMSRMKLQIVTLMTAMSLQDWKFLAARAGGDDEFMDGDLVRAAGNLAGNSVHYVLKKSGRGVESVFKRGSSSLGAGIEKAASKVGAGAVGSSVNSVVSGVGGGVGEAVSGVGMGAGYVVQGVGRGVGQVVGGVTGGASMMVKGTAKGIASGDGKAVANSVVEGAKSVGSGVGHGVSSVVVGTADGVYSVGKGLFSGVRSVGRGVVGAVRMKKDSTDADVSDEGRPSERSGRTGFKRRGRFN